MTVAPPSSSRADHRRGDRALRRAGHHRDFVAVAAVVRVLRAGGDPAVQRGVDLTPGRQRLALPPGRLGGHDVAGALEPLRQPRPVGVGLVVVDQPQLDQVFAGAGPPVVEHHGLLAVEHRRHQPRPVGAEFGGDQVDQLGVAGCRRHGDRVVQPQLAQHQASRRREHAVAAGDLLGELTQRGGVDGRAAAAAGRRQRHRNPAACGHRRDRGVDDLVDGGGVGQRALVQVPHRAAANAGAFAGPERDLDRDVLNPAVAELPGLLHPLGDGGGPLAGRAQHRPQLVVDRVGKHWPVRLIRARQLGDLRRAARPGRPRRRRRWRPGSARNPGRPAVGSAATTRRR